MYFKYYLISILHLPAKLRLKLKLKSSNISVGKNVIFLKSPLIDIRNEGEMVLGNNVVINSKNKGYHVNMFNKCKLMTSENGAKIIVGDNTRIHGSCIHATKSIKIGKNCLIAANCQLFDNNGHDLSFEEVENRINTTGVSREIVIEDNVWLGTGVIVLPGVKIGYGSIISANSVVHKNIPPMVIASGNPAKIIKKMIS